MGANTAWRNGYGGNLKWGGTAVPFGLTSKCQCCGRDRGVMTGHEIGDMPPEPDWPFEQHDCPLCNMIEAINNTPGTSLLAVLTNHPDGDDN